VVAGALFDEGWDEVSCGDDQLKGCIAARRDVIEGCEVVGRRGKGFCEERRVMVNLGVNFQDVRIEVRALGILIAAILRDDLTEVYPRMR